MILTRRQMIRGTISLGATALGGCAFVRPINLFCPDDPRISDPNTPLTIDVHAHVFNGSDIQVERYITLIRKLKELGQILQEVGWSIAPNGAEEASVLRGINQQLSAGCGPRDFERIHVAHREEQYRAGAGELRRALSAAQRHRLAIRATAEGKAVAQAIRSLPRTYAQYRKRQLEKSFIGGSLDAVIEFVLRQFQYRYVNVFDFLTEYSSGRARKIDLIVCHFLDFDWPLARGRPTMTPIADQIDVMEQISILTGGRVHCYVPFDPMKQVAYDLQYPTESPMDLVQKAISQGCIGVKLYPPMGFAPYGNASLGRGFWNKPWLPDEIKRISNLGELLDRALFQLYSWCVANDVPIMAHTSPSEGPCPEFEKLTAAQYWRNVPNGLRVNFGHFGDTELAEGTDAKTLAYCDLMGGPGSQGAHYYADAAYLSHVMRGRRQLTEALRHLFRKTKSKESAALAQRLMYGSDWEMLVIEGVASENYLKNFEQILWELDRDPSLGAQGKLSARFFGINAANYLSLRSGSATRARLDAFYLSRGLRTPQWAQKVDALPLIG
jgi:hypothetical protein